jgi:hypothetical protein
MCGCSPNGALTVIEKVYLRAKARLRSAEESASFLQRYQCWALVVAGDEHSARLSLYSPATDNIIVRSFAATKHRKTVWQEPTGPCGGEC